MTTDSRELRLLDAISRRKRDPSNFMSWRLSVDGRLDTLFKSVSNEIEARNLGKHIAKYAYHNGFDGACVIKTFR